MMHLPPDASLDGATLIAPSCVVLETLMQIHVLLHLDVEWMDVA
jgi:hypothetical protein